VAETQLRRTPLYAEHVRLGARMVPFAGWDMPVQYQSIIQEHRAVREAVGAFDVSHMGEFRISGPGAVAFLQHITPNDVSTVAVGASQYSCLLQPDAGIVDDIFIYRPADYFLVVVNASNIAKVADWLAEHAHDGADVANISDETALIAVQGPRAIAAVQPLSDEDLSTLPRRGIRSGTIAGVPALVARTGYTGEDGLEIFCESGRASALWTTLLGNAAEPIQPCGLGARDTLRLEAGNLLYGHDMDERVTPLEAGLSFIVKLGKGDFLGREALIQAKETGLRQRLVGFDMVERGVPRAECAVQLGGDVVGRVTSGSYAPTLEKNIGMAYVPPTLTTLGQELDVVIRERPVRAQVVKLPFYRSKSRTAAGA
jgi:aminomethyltransferase